MNNDSANTIYEHPLNELIRACLRVEYMFQEIQTQLDRLSTPQDTRILIRWFLELIVLLDRPDLKPRLSKEFNRLSNKFTHQLESEPKKASIEKSIAKTQTIQKLKNFVSHFLNKPGKITENIRKNEFLTNLKQALLNPAGDSPIDTPFYTHWLNLPIETQKYQCQHWLNEITEIQKTINLLLDLVRKSETPENLIAQKGFYIQPLNPNLPLQLLRVVLPKNADFYPAISAGKHRASLRFMQIHPQPVENLIEKSINHGKQKGCRQTENNIAFQLACCIL